MRIAAVHQITGNKCCGGKSERQLNKIATHPKCPFRPSRFLQSGRSAEPGFFELELSEAVACDLTQPARSGPWYFSPKAVAWHVIGIAAKENARQKGSDIGHFVVSYRQSTGDIGYPAIKPDIFVA